MRSSPASHAARGGLDRRLRRARARDPGADRAGRLRGARRPAHGVPAGRRRGAGRAPVSRRGLPRPGGVQGADHGPLRPRLRAAACPRPTTGATRSRWASSPRAHLRLLLPGSRLARGEWRPSGVSRWSSDGGRGTVGGGSAQDARTVRSKDAKRPRTASPDRRARRRGCSPRARPAQPAGNRPPRRLRRLPRPASRPGQRGRARQPARPALAARGARHLAHERVPPLRRRLEPARRRLLPRRRLRRSSA